NVLDDDNEESDICSQSNHIQNIKLKKPIISYKQIIKTDTALFRSDLALAYQDFGYNASLISKYYGFYESASYTQNDGYTEIKYHLHKNDVVTIRVNNYEGYAMVKGIFKHKNNDGSYYPFVYVDWFEDTSRKHIKVNCPIFVLHQDTSRRRIFSLTNVDG
ncbi:19931_t:CDS:2, partial [Racocetra persica]